VLYSSGMEVDDRLLSLAAELAKLERRKREILNELNGRGFDDKQRQLVLGILGESPQAKFGFDDDLGPLFRHSGSRRNILAEIRDLLASRPTDEFTAIEIKNHLGIQPPNEKSFYSALAKLHKLGQIRRVGRARYKTAARGAKVRLNSSAGPSK
jgi:hypothetical protein